MCRELAGRRCACVCGPGPTVEEHTCHISCLSILNPQTVVPVPVCGCRRCRYWFHRFPPVLAPRPVAVVVSADTGTGTGTGTDRDRPATGTGTGTGTGGTGGPVVPVPVPVPVRPGPVTGTGTGAGTGHRSSVEQIRLPQACHVLCLGTTALRDVSCTFVTPVGSPKLHHTYLPTYGMPNRKLPRDAVGWPKRPVSARRREPAAGASLGSAAGWGRGRAQGSHLTCSFV